MRGYEVIESNAKVLKYLIRRTVITKERSDIIRTYFAFHPPIMEVFEDYSLCILLIQKRFYIFQMYRNKQISVFHNRVFSIRPQKSL